MKHTLIALALASPAALAAPTLTANPYAKAPAAVTLTIDGGAPIACTFASVAGGWQPTCDLASITAPAGVRLGSTLAV